ncbi:MAG: tRNA (adenosine(37)-N6)-threonylcarbamoyltransferase complex ATPase subunit type 1 TsaE [Patescibacteria group bacterium]
MEYISKSEEETFKIARDLAFKAKPGDVFALEGDLGSGKTTFTKGFASALGIKENITSPTFVILKKYSLPENQQKISFLVHIDCYRMGSIQDAYSIGIDELFENKDAVILLEWPDKIKEILPSRTVELRFEYIDDKTRKMLIPDNLEDR